MLLKKIKIKKRELTLGNLHLAARFRGPTAGHLFTSALVAFARSLRCYAGTMGSGPYSPYFNDSDRSEVTRDAPGLEISLLEVHFSKGVHIPREWLTNQVT